MKKEETKQSNLSRLMGYAGNHRYFTYASWVLSAVSALVTLVPFVYIWKILRDVLNAAPNYVQAVNIPHYGWMAVLFAVLSYLIYIAALMCSHLSAFRVATNLRLAVSEHLAVLPLGFAETFGSGKLRKIIHESTGAAETYLAHQLPDQSNAIATPVGLLGLLLAFDWRLGLLSLAPVVLAFLIMATMTGKRMVEKCGSTETPWRPCPTRQWNTSGAFRWSRPSGRVCFPSKSSRPPLMSTKSGSSPTPKTCACP